MEPITIETMIVEMGVEQVVDWDTTGCDSASTSTATTEEESSSCESSTKSPPIAVALKKITIQSHQQIQQQLYQQQVHRQQAFQQQAYYQAQSTMYATNYYIYPQGPGVMAAPKYNRGRGKKQYPHGQQQQQEPQGSMTLAPQIHKKKNRRPKKNKRARMYGCTLTKAEQDRYLALDCEMVGVGDLGTHSALARVTLVDWHGNVVMDELVQPQWQVTDYRTFVSGITKELLDGATMNFATAQARVMDHLQGKILVGHALENDLQVLNISHPWYMIRDTAAYEPYMKTSGCGSSFQNSRGLWPRGLKDLCREKLHREVQVVRRPHCPKEDALAALDLYRLVLSKWEKTIEFMLQRQYYLRATRNRTWEELFALGCFAYINYV